MSGHLITLLLLIIITTTFAGVTFPHIIRELRRGHHHH